MFNSNEKIDIKYDKIKDTIKKKKIPTQKWKIKLSQYLCVMQNAMNV